MSETRQQDPERIYLEPAPGSPEGRLWCEDDVWHDDWGEPGIEYVRADLPAAEISRLTRELEEARERERGVRSAVIRAVAALVRLDLRWDPREETEWVRRESLVRTALRLKDEVLALSTPQEASGE